jgi:hypothetical protein
VNIILLLSILSVSGGQIDDFLHNIAPHLSYLVSGSEILPDSKPINTKGQSPFESPKIRLRRIKTRGDEEKPLIFGIEGIYSDYELGYYNYVLRTPAFNGYISWQTRFLSPYLKLGVYWLKQGTGQSALGGLSLQPLASFGCNLRPKILSFLFFRFGYGTLSAIEYLPSDPYYNYHFKNFHTLNISLIGFKKIQAFTPFITLGLLPSYISGNYRNDAKGIEERFSNLILGWHLGLGFKIFFVKFNAELVNNRLSASTSFNL